MGERVIYSTLCALQGSTREQLAPMIDMASFWAKQLRGPGQFTGRIVLLTNVSDLQLEGVEAVQVPFRATDRQSLFVERVRRYRYLPVGPGDAVMQMDLDAMAVAPVEALFERIRPGVLVAARSGMPALHHDHAGGLMSRRQRWLYRLRRWDRRPGVSACITACEGGDWRHLMGRWAAAIRCRGRARPLPILGDQAFLNWVFLSGAAPVRRLPGHLIRHVLRPGVSPDDPGVRRAVVLHFPMAERVPEMRRLARS